MALECEDPWTSCVDTKRKFLNQELDVDDELLYSLMSKSLTNGKKLLLQEDKESIESGDSASASSPSNPAKVKSLVDILRYRGPKKDTFYLFCSSLKEIGREWIVRKLHGQDKSRRRVQSAPVQSVEGQSLDDLHQAYQGGSEHSDRKWMTEGIPPRQQQSQEFQFHSQAKVTRSKSQQWPSFQRCPFEKKDSLLSGKKTSDDFSTNSRDSYAKHVLSCSEAKATSTGSGPLPEIPDEKFSVPESGLAQEIHEREDVQYQNLKEKYSEALSKLEQVQTELASTKEDLKRSGERVFHLVDVGAKPDFAFLTFTFFRKI
eukprot:m.210518 g.210518  ORF g.210518 m.210518 type:complete len:317 (+) comp39745_c0_seq83:269-1219(+)